MLFDFCRFLCLNRNNKTKYIKGDSMDELNKNPFEDNSLSTEQDKNVDSSSTQDNNTPVVNIDDIASDNSTQSIVRKETQSQTQIVSQPISTENTQPQTSQTNDNTTPTEPSQPSAPVDNSIFVPEYIPNSNTQSATPEPHTSVDTVPGKVELNMFVARLGCVMNNYNYLITIMLPILYLMPILYIFGAALNIMAILVISIVTFLLIYTRYSWDDMMIISPENADEIIAICYDYIVPIATFTFLGTSILSLICMIISRKNVSIFRLISSIIFVIISIVSIVMYFYIKANGGLEI